MFEHEEFSAAPEVALADAMTKFDKEFIAEATTNVCSLVVTECFLFRVLKLCYDNSVHFS